MIVSQEVFKDPERIFQTKTKELLDFTCKNVSVVPLKNYLPVFIHCKFTIGNTNWNGTNSESCSKFLFFEILTTSFYLILLVAYVGMSQGRFMQSFILPIIKPLRKWPEATFVFESRNIRLGTWLRKNAIITQKPRQVDVNVAREIIMS